MTIEYDEGKWWWTVGEGYPTTLLYSEEYAFELIEKNNLECIRDEQHYKLYEK